MLRASNSCDPVSSVSAGYIGTTSDTDHIPSIFSILKKLMDRLLPSDETMKVLLVDNVTLNIIAMSCSQSFLLSRGVFLVDQVPGDRQRHEMKSMRCIIFVRPDPDTIETVCRELQMAKYSSYSIVFCGVISSEYLDRLAHADQEGLVIQVDEFFCDFNPVNHDLFLIEYNTLSMNLLSTNSAPRRFTRLAYGLASLSVALRRRPIIRYQRSSPFVSRVVTELNNIYHNDPALYDYHNKDTLLLVLDRNDDPVTPLLTPWTYQAMLHEHIGLKHNILLLPENIGNGEEQGYAFCEQDDLFFASNLCHNWGDLCTNVKLYVDKCKEALNLDRTTVTIEDLRQFMQRMPQNRSLTESVTKHMTVVTHLTRSVQDYHLLDVSLLEQDIVASYSPSEHWNRLESLLTRHDIRSSDKLRLCLLYNLRYENVDQPSKASPFLNTMGNTCAQLLRKLRSYYGHDRPVDGLFADSGIMDTIVKTFVDTRNNYTRHEPALKRTLLHLLSGRLDSTMYPYLNISSAPSALSGTNGGLYKPKEVIVFICGGCTFEEAALVRAINQKSAYKATNMNSFYGEGAKVKVILGGDCILNSSQFLEYLSQLP